MHRNAILCNICGRSFFPQSLKFHTPACIKKHENIPIPCQYCDIEYKQKDMPNHLRKCKKAKRMMKQNKRNKVTNSFHMHK
jgi:hypothetical protein